MPDDKYREPFLLLSPDWHSRLQRVAAVCAISPHDFARETLEAEIIRREMWLERQGEVERWHELLLSLPASARLH